MQSDHISRISDFLSHGLRNILLKEKKISISESLTIVVYILMTSSPQKIKIFGRGNQKSQLFSLELQSVLFKKIKPVQSVFPVYRKGKFL